MTSSRLTKELKIRTSFLKNTLYDFFFNDNIYFFIQSEAIVHRTSQIVAKMPLLDHKKLRVRSEWGHNVTFFLYEKGQFANNNVLFIEIGSVLFSYNNAKGRFGICGFLLKNEEI